MRAAGGWPGVWLGLPGVIAAARVHGCAAACLLPAAPCVTCCTQALPPSHFPFQTWRLLRCWTAWMRAPRTSCRRAAAAALWDAAAAAAAAAMLQCCCAASGQLQREGNVLLWCCWCDCSRLQGDCKELRCRPCLAACRRRGTRTCPQTSAGSTRLIHASSGGEAPAPPARAVEAQAACPSALHISFPPLPSSRVLAGCPGDAAMRPTTTNTCPINPPRHPAGSRASWGWTSAFLTPRSRAPPPR